MLEHLFATEVLVAIIGSLSAGGLLWLRHFLEQSAKKKESEKPKDSVLAAIEHNDQIDIKLEFLREALLADRIAIYRFHNGGYYYPHTAMQKFSMVYERVSPGIASLIHSHQNFLVSAFHWFLNRAVKEKNFYYPNIEDIEEYALKDFLRQYGVLSMYAFPIKSLNGNKLGVFCIQYIKDEQTLTEDQLEQINAEVNIFAGYLE